MRSEEIKAELEAVRWNLKPLQDRAATLERRYRDALSLEFIAANGITRDQVEACFGEGKPYFGHLREFIKWLDWHPGKPWAEWNGTLYRVSDLHANDWSGTPAQFDHLPK